MSAAESGDTREAVPAESTYVHGDLGAGPRSTQATRSGVGGREGGERRMVPRERPRSYYGRPVVKPPIWTWEIPTYFFVGGTGGASSAIAFAAERAGNRTLARRSWLVALVSIAAGPMLLVSDLGRPARFYNMLRVFKVTSPMSVGSWLLLANGVALAPAAAYGVLRWPRRIGPPAQAAAALLGLPLTTYTAALLANTAIPAWSDARWELTFRFAGSAGASAGAAATLLTPPRAAGPARRVAIGAAIAENLATEVIERRLGEVGEPYGEGVAGRLVAAAKVATAAGAVLLASARGSRRRTRAGAAMLLVGSALARWGGFRAGFQSAGDPRYTVGPQRERLAKRS
jgi:formate-dependent nitrite reductase membrane component NrfD